SFASVLKYVATTSKVNIVPDWNSLKTIGIDASTPVNLSLTDARTDSSAAVVLKKVLDSVSHDPSIKADLAVTDGIVTVASSDAIRRHTTTQLFNITDLLLEIPDFADVPKLDLAEIMNAQNNPNRAIKTDPFAQAGEKADPRIAR